MTIDLDHLKQIGNQDLERLAHAESSEDILDVIDHVRALLTDVELSVDTERNPTQSSRDTAISIYRMLRQGIEPQALSLHFPVRQRVNQILDALDNGMDAINLKGLTAFESRQP